MSRTRIGISIDILGITNFEINLDITIGIYAVSRNILRHFYASLQSCHISSSFLFFFFLVVSDLRYCLFRFVIAQGKKEDETMSRHVSRKGSTSVAVFRISEFSIGSFLRRPSSF